MKPRLIEQWKTEFSEFCLKYFKNNTFLNDSSDHKKFGTTLIYKALKYMEVNLDTKD